MMMIPKIKIFFTINIINTFCWNKLYCGIFYLRFESRFSLKQVYLRRISNVRVVELVDTLL